MKEFVISAFADEINKDLSVQMDVLSEHNISCIEFRSADGKNVLNYTISEIKEIKKQLDDRNFKISAVGSPIGKVKIEEDFEEEKERFKHILEIAKILDTKYIRLFSFYLPKEENFDIYKDEVLSRLNSFIEIAKGSGIMLLHENERAIYGDTAKRCLDIMQALYSDSFGAIFDPANFVVCGEDVKAAYDMLKDYIIYFHIKDAIAKTGEMMPAGKGDGMIPYILSDMKKSGRGGFLSLEPHLAHFTGFSKLENNPNAQLKKFDNKETFKIAADSLKEVLKNI